MHSALLKTQPKSSEANRNLQAPHLNNSFLSTAKAHQQCIDPQPPRGGCPDSCQKAFQPNRAPTELPQTSAWPCRKMCCVGFSWCLRPQSVGCWHKHRPNRTYCLTILAPEHAAPSRPETCTLVPRGSVQQFFLRMLQAKRLTFPQVLALLRFIFINHWSGAQKWTGPRLSKDFKRRLYYWVKEEWITIIL